MKKITRSAPSSSFAPAKGVPDHGEIAIRAEVLWREKGCPWACDDAIWLEAEQQLLHPSRPDLGIEFDRESDDLMTEVNERFPSPGRATTSL